MELVKKSQFQVGCVVQRIRLDKKPADKGTIIDRDWDSGTIIIRWEPSETWGAYTKVYSVDEAIRNLEVVA